MKHATGRPASSQLTLLKRKLNTLSTPALHPSQEPVQSGGPVRRLEPAFLLTALIPETLPQFAAIDPSFPPTIAVRRPGTQLPPTAFELDAVFAGSYLDGKFGEILGRVWPGNGGELTVVLPFLDWKQPQRGVHLVEGVCEEILTLIFAEGKKCPDSRVSFSAIKAGAETELLADSLVSCDYDVGIKVREHPVAGFFAENATSVNLSTVGLKKASHVVKQAVKSNFVAGRFLSGGKPKVEQYHHGLVSFTCEVVNRDAGTYRKTRIHVLHLSRPRPQPQIRPQSQPRTATRCREDQTLRAVYKIVDYLGDAKLMALPGTPVAGWRDSKLTRLCRGGLGGGGLGIFVFDFGSAAGCDFNEMAATLEYGARIRACRNCAYSVDTRLYCRPLRRPSEQTPPDWESWQKDKERAAWTYFEAEAKCVTRS